MPIELFKPAPVAAPATPADVATASVGAQRSKLLAEMLQKMSTGERLPGSNLEGASRVVAAGLGGYHQAQAHQQELAKQQAIVEALNADPNITPLERMLVASGNDGATNTVVQGQLSRRTAESTRAHESAEWTRRNEIESKQLTEREKIKNERALAMADVKFEAALRMNREKGATNLEIARQRAEWARIRNRETLDSREATAAADRALRGAIAERKDETTNRIADQSDGTRNRLGDQADVTRNRLGDQTDARQRDIAALTDARARAIAIAGNDTKLSLVDRRHAGNMELEDKRGQNRVELQGMRGDQQLNNIAAQGTQRMDQLGLQGQQRMDQLGVQGQQRLDQIGAQGQNQLNNIAAQGSNSMTVTNAKIAAGVAHDERQNAHQLARDENQHERKLELAEIQTAARHKDTLTRTRAMLEAQGLRLEANAKKPGELSEKGQKKLEEIAEQQAIFADLAKEYRPSFSGMGGGFAAAADARIAAAHAFPGMSGRNAADAAKFWQKYKRFSELVERHGLFGSALTAPEQGQWQLADVAPNKSDASNVANFNSRQRFMKHKAASVIASQRSKNIPDSVISSVMGFDINNLDAAFPEFGPNAMMPGAAPPAPAPAPAAAPTAAPAAAPAPAPATQGPQRKQLPDGRWAVQVNGTWQFE